MRREALAPGHEGRLAVGGFEAVQHPAPKGEPELQRDSDFAVRRGGKELDQRAHVHRPSLGRVREREPFPQGEAGHFHPGLHAATELVPLGIEAPPRVIDLGVLPVDLRLVDGGDGVDGSRLAARHPRPTEDAELLHRAGLA